MITWRTSRFILMSFLLNGVVVAVAVWTMVNQGAVLAYVQRAIPAFRSSPAATPLASPASADGAGQAADLPRYPAVQVTPPAVSVFDPST